MTTGEMVKVSMAEPKDGDKLLMCKHQDGTAMETFLKHEQKPDYSAFIVLCKACYDRYAKGYTCKLNYAVVGDGFPLDAFKKFWGSANWNWGLQ